VTALVPAHNISIAVVSVSIVLLALLGALGARTGGAPVARAVGRVVLLGAAAMLLTIGLGRLFGTSIG
jgi:VIT1/CCC1 family predicted Fe2+/Mn2+ transporter